MNSKFKKSVSAIREFNRYYTNLLGLLDRHILKSSFSLSEARILLEIETTENCTLKHLTQNLCMDPGYLSRTIKQFETNNLIEKKPSIEDKRVHFLSLTPKGKESLEILQLSSDKQIYNLIHPLSNDDQTKLVQSMASVQHILSAVKNIQPENITIRHHIKPGDAGYITYMHGWIYKKEYDYSNAFEAYVAKSFYDFLSQYNANKDRLWVAEHNNEIIGSIGIVGHGSKAQLRWFILHPGYRGLGLGKRLLNDAVSYCRKKNYKSIFLDTTNDLEQAISVYTKAGFTQISEKENHSWRNDLTELKFELVLK